MVFQMSNIPEFENLGNYDMDFLTGPTNKSDVATNKGNLDTNLESFSFDDLNISLDDMEDDFKEIDSEMEAEVKESRSLGIDLSFGNIANKSDDMLELSSDIKTSSNIVIDSDDAFLQDILREHVIQEEESTYKDVSEEITDEFSSFLNDTSTSVNLLPDQVSSDDSLQYPFIFVDKITHIELGFYVKDEILLENPNEETLPFVVKLDDDLIQVGYIIPSLKSFLGIKQLCGTRQLYLATGPNEFSEISGQDLLVFLLEDLE